jgi:hypothetical protein
MKREFVIVIFLSIIFLGMPGLEYAQNTDETAIKAALTNLINLSKTKSFDKAAKLIAYDGEDKNRVLKDSYNPAVKDELNQVKRICKKINALLELSAKFEFGQFKVVNPEGKESFSIDVIFISGEQKLVTNFSFIKNDKEYLLTSMN